MTSWVVWQVWQTTSRSRARLDSGIVTLTKLQHECQQHQFHLSGDSHTLVVKYCEQIAFDHLRQLVGFTQQWYFQHLGILCFCTWFGELKMMWSGIFARSILDFQGGYVFGDCFRVHLQMWRFPYHMFGLCLLTCHYVVRRTSWIIAAQMFLLCSFRYLWGRLRLKLTIQPDSERLLHSAKWIAGPQAFYGRKVGSTQMGSVDSGDDFSFIWHLIYNNCSLKLMPIPVHITLKSALFKAPSRSKSTALGSFGPICVAELLMWLPYPLFQADSVSFWLALWGFMRWLLEFEAGHAAQRSRDYSELVLIASENGRPISGPKGCMYPVKSGNAFGQQLLQHWVFLHHFCVWLTYWLGIAPADFRSKTAPFWHCCLGKCPWHLGPDASTLAPDMGLCCVTFSIASRPVGREHFAGLAFESR